MNKIEINTAHNIVISQDAATVWQRILAFGIDIIILLFYVIFASVISAGNTTLQYLFIIPVVGFYHIIFELFNKGQSLGKMILKIRVVSLKGYSPTPRALFIRWVFRMVDVLLSSGVVAILAINSSKKNQRLGDRLAQCLVVSINQDYIVSLNRISSLDIDDNKILYHGVTRYSDKDMLLVKHTLQRASKYRNQETRDVLAQLATKIASDLNISTEKIKNAAFLKQVLQDYIILTR